MKFFILLFFSWNVALGHDIIQFPIVHHESIEEKIVGGNISQSYLNEIFGVNPENYVETFTKPSKPPTNCSVKLYKVLQSQYYAEVLIGSPGQTFKMLMDTSSKTSWIPSVLCSPYAVPACAIRNKYASSKSTTFKSLKQEIKIPTDKGTLVGYLGQEKFHVGSLSVMNQTFAEIAEMPLFELFHAGYDGVIGLGYSSDPKDDRPFLQKFFKQHPTVKPIFSMYFNRDETTSKGGTLFLGGSEKKHYNGSFTYLPVKNINIWSFKMDYISINYILPYRNTTAKVCENGCEVVPSSGDLLISGPKRDIQKINRLIEADYVPFLDRYAVSCNLINKFPSITFYLGGKPFTLKGRHYVQQVSFGPVMLCLSAFAELKNGGDLWTLGISFMAQYYMKFDLEKKRIGVAQAVGNM